MSQQQQQQQQEKHINETLTKRYSLSNRIILFEFFFQIQAKSSHICFVVAIVCCLL
jgi:hypothetical protein